MIDYRGGIDTVPIKFSIEEDREIGRLGRIEGTAKPDGAFVGGVSAFEAAGGFDHAVSSGRKCAVVRASHATMPFFRNRIARVKNHVEDPAMFRDESSG